MTASNPCCPKCNGYRSEKYPKRPECNDQYCPCHKETPAAKFCECKFPLIDHSRNVDVCQACGLSVVDADWQNKEGFIEKKIVPPQPAAVEKAKPYFSFFPKLKPLTDAEKKEMIAGISFEPEKESWEEQVDDFAESQSIGWLNDTMTRKQFKESLKSFISRIAAQSEKKGRETQEKYQELIFAVGSIHPNETRHETALRYIQQAEEGSSVAARSSEEGKTGL